MNGPSLVILGLAAVMFAFGLSVIFTKRLAFIVQDHSPVPLHSASAGVSLAREISASTTELDHLTANLQGEELRLAKKHISTLHAIAIRLAGSRAHELYGRPEVDEQELNIDTEQPPVEQPDSLIDALHDWVYSRVSDFSLHEAASDCLKLDASKLTPSMQICIGLTLRKLGCTQVERRHSLGWIGYWYKPPVRNEAASTSGKPESKDETEELQA